MALEHEIPTHLSVEDKPFFGMTFQQFVTVVLGVGGAATLYNYGLGWLPELIRLIVVTGMALLSMALALINLGGMPLTEWLFTRLFFHLRVQQAIFGLWEFQQSQSENPGSKDRE